MPNYLKEYLKVPLSYIQKIDKTVIDKKTQKTSYIEIITKDFRYLKLIFETVEDCNNSMQRITFLAFPENEMLNIFAFDYFYPFDTESDLFENGWDIYKDPISEFERQGIDFKNPVSITLHNQSY